MQNQYGWKPDLPDQRDHTFVPMRHFFLRAPASIDLRPRCPAIYDQGQLGSCTANAIAAALEFDQMKQGEGTMVLSRLFIYYNERVMEGTVSSDSGAAIRDGIKSVNRQGACPETEWPYDITQFATQPPAQAYQDAMQHRSMQYARVPRNLGQMKACLMTGYPFVFGFTVYESFESSAVASTGIVPLPAHDEQILGGHAVVAVGYDDIQQRFLVRNSWGDGWGMQGYCTMPYAYLLNNGLASDFWMIRSVE
jgi:C1A family cysteine protease